jgi:DNA repair photolyase
MGPPRILEKEFAVNYGRNRTIFIEHMNDIFGPGIEPNWIIRILEHCRIFPDNTYVFQTKDPWAANNYFDFFPNRILFGTTIETNRKIPQSQAPPPIERYRAMKYFKERGLARCFKSFELFITIEPIMTFDRPQLLSWIKEISPAFVNIGADSKGCGLPEPTPLEVRHLIDSLSMAGIPIRKKMNLGRFGIQGEHG